MRTIPQTLNRLAQTGKFPLNLFSDHDRFSKRLDELQASVPSALPPKTFFKH